MLVVLYDDTGLRGLVAVRRADRDADAAAPGRRRPDVLAVAHDRALLADALDVPDRSQPSPERLRVDLGVLDRLPGLQLPHPAGERDDGARCCATPAGARSGSARTTTSRSTPGRMGSSKKEWPLGLGYDRFYGFIGGETNHWYPDLAEDNHYIDQPYLPEDGYHLSKDLADQALRVHPRLEAVRARQALVPVVLPGRQPRAAPRAAGVHRQVQGQVRRRLRGLPRVGAAADDREGHPARGHRADADQPDARGHVQRRATRCGRGTRCPTTRSALFSRMAEVYAGFSEYTDHQVGRIVDYLEESGPARQHDRSSTAPTTAPRARAARTARSTRTSSSTAGRTRSRTTCR